MMYAVFTALPSTGGHRVPGIQRHEQSAAIDDPLVGNRPAFPDFINGLVGSQHPGCVRVPDDSRQLGRRKLKPHRYGHAAQASQGQESQEDFRSVGQKQGDMIPGAKLPSSGEDRPGVPASSSTREFVQTSEPGKTSRSFSPDCVR